MRTAILGGAFDPVHPGHLHMIHCAAEHSFCDRIVLVPASGKHHCLGTKRMTATAEQRYTMALLAIEDFRELYPDDEIQLEVSRVELDSDSVCHTFETVEKLRDQMGLEGKVGLILGDDHFADLPLWHRFDGLRENCRFFFCRRTESPVAQAPDGLEMEYAQDEPLVGFSSEKIRSKEIRPESLTMRVAAYVRENGIYN